MKNLDEQLKKICHLSELNDFETVRQLCHEMIDYSDAKPMTKKKHHMVLDRKPDNLLQYWASDYRLSGLGLKVIK